MMPTSEPRSNDAARGIYLYCFTRSNAVSERADVCRLTVQGIAAVFTRVPLAEWEESTLANRLKDSRWLIPWALTHQQVIESQLARAPVLPVRFGAVFSSEDALCQFVASRVETISRFLDTIAEREEWAVKGMLDPAVTEAWLETYDLDLAALRQQLPERPGARYFQAKRLKAELQKRCQQWEHVLRQTLWEELNSKTLEVCSLRPQQLEDGAGKMIFHAACLLAKPAVVDFERHVQQVQDQFAAQGLTLETTGPWPPYNFCPDLGGTWQ
jgi:hypothetical protein